MATRRRSLVSRYKQLTLWNRLSAWGSAASLVGLPLGIVGLVLTIVSFYLTPRDAHPVSPRMESETTIDENPEGSKELGTSSTPQRNSDADSADSPETSLPLAESTIVPTAMSQESKHYIREGTAREIIHNLKGVESSRKFQDRVSDLYLNRWVAQPGWHGIVFEQPNETSEKPAETAETWYVSLKEKGSDVIIMVWTSASAAGFRKGDCVRVTGRIRRISATGSISLADATIVSD